MNIGLELYNKTTRRLLKLRASSVFHLSLPIITASKSHHFVRWIKYTYNQPMVLLGIASVAIWGVRGYQLGLESLEARIVVHQKNEAVYEEDIAFLKYDVKMTENELHDFYKNNSEVFVSESDSNVNEIKEENNQVNDRFKKVEGYHAVPHPYTGNYMPSRPDLSFAGLDDSVYKTNVSETITSVPRIESTASKSSGSLIVMMTVQIENPRKSQSPRVDKRNGLMTQKLGDGFKFNKKACFVCGSLNHLIKDCNFYENKMVGKSMLNNMGRITVLTKSGNVPVNTAKQGSSRAAVSNSTTRYVNTAASRPTVNDAKPRSNVFHKSHSSVKRIIYQRMAPKNSDFKEKVNTAKVKNVVGN
ncbi:hypothetical protein Tco_0480493 [Tanacetum coccineum]